jgi:predicted HicB family RNase H-like nuclease
MARTPLRPFRIDDDLYFAALAKARAEGTSLSAVVVAALKRYLKRTTRHEGA